MATQQTVKTALATNGQMKPAVNTLESLLKSVSVRQRFDDMLGKKAAGFVSSILSVSNQNKMLKTADPITVISAAAVAASVDLPINPSLGYAHIVPYRDNKTGKTVAQFQMGWRGYVQLAQRTGVYKTMNAGLIYEGQIKSNDLLTGEIVLDEAGKVSDKVIGYFAHFELLNGFKKTVFVSADAAEKHGKRYSKSYATGQWAKDFDAMAIKTAIKQLLGKWAPLSIDYQMQKALQMDAAVVKDDGTPEYPDNPAHETVDAETVNTATGETQDEIQEVEPDEKTEIPFGK